MTRAEQSNAIRARAASALDRTTRAGAAAVLIAYRLLASPVIHSIGIAAPACRFEPSCSVYARQAIEARGLIRGGYLALRRLLRCHPWGGFGYDPAPSTAPGIRR